MTDAGWNFGLLALFAVQHSGMARLRVSRRVYALASYAVVGLGWPLWRPMGDTLWQTPGWLWAGWAASFGLLVWAVASIGAGELLGWLEPGPTRFREPFFFRYSRHPIYVAVLLILWLQPVMTEGGLLVAVTLTGYLFVGMELEERKLERELGGTYRDYQQRVRRLL